MTLDKGPLGTSKRPPQSRGETTRVSKLSGWRKCAFSSKPGVPSQSTATGRLRAGAASIGGSKDHVLGSYCRFNMPSSASRLLQAVDGAAGSLAPWRKLQICRKCGSSCERTRTSWKSWAAPRNMQFRVRQIRSVAFWYWKGCGDSCGICTEAFDHACPSCNQPGDQCPPALGACGHSFHLHCINQWLQQGSNPLCPMCRREFCFKSARPVETPCTLR
eukprot:Polyplicarium_translucidae@DN1893_c0_g1_i3.p2